MRLCVHVLCHEHTYDDPNPRVRAVNEPKPPHWLPGGAPGGHAAPGREARRAWRRWRPTVRNCLPRFQLVGDTLPPDCLQLATKRVVRHSHCQPAVPAAQRGASARHLAPRPALYFSSGLLDISLGLLDIRVSILAFRDRRVFQIGQPHCDMRAPCNLESDLVSDILNPG